MTKNQKTIAIVLALGVVALMFVQRRTTAATAPAPSGMEWRYSPWAGKEVLVPIGAVI